jgi:hypothetical protein
MILNIIYLDLLYTSEWLTPFLENKNIDDQGVSYIDETRNLYLETSGFSSSIMLVNLGSTLIFIAMLIALYVIYYLLKYIGFLYPR